MWQGITELSPLYYLVTRFLCALLPHPFWPWKCLPYKKFSCCGVGLPAAKVGIVEAKEATYLHPAALQWPQVGMRELDIEEAILHEPHSGTRLEATSVPPEEA